MFWDSPDYDPFAPVNDTKGLPKGESRPTHSMTKSSDHSKLSWQQSNSTGYRKREIDVLFKNGAKQTYTVEYSMIDWFDFARLVWPFRMEGNTEIIEVPEAHCVFTYGKPKFNQCVYTASGDYIQARWGRKLDISDCDWLAEHPLATDDGVPHGYTPTCIHELVLPYGMGVERVRIRKDTSVLGDHMLGWMQALGCNPFGMVDRATTNEEAAKRLGMSLEEANALWRFEFHENPLPGSVIGEKGWSNNTGKGVSVGNFGGHSRYLAPRAGSGNWTISVQLAPTPDYLVPPPSEPYIPRKGTPTLVATGVTDPDGEVIATKSGTGNKWIPQSKRVRSIVHYKDDATPSTPATTPTTGTERVSVTPLTATGEKATSTYKVQLYDCGYCKKPQCCYYDELLCADCQKLPTAQTDDALKIHNTPMSEQKSLPLGNGSRGRIDQVVASPELDICANCGMTDRVPDEFNPMLQFVCQDCVSLAFHGFECPGCKADLGKYPPEPVDFTASPDESEDPSVATWRCTQCKEDMTTAEPPKKYKGLHPFDIAEYIWDPVDWGEDLEDVLMDGAEGDDEESTLSRKNGQRGVTHGTH